MVEVRLEAVSKRFGAVVALADTDLRIAPGEFFSLLGPSGCGKTTTLRIIAGLEQPSSGRVWFGANDVTDLPTHRRGVGMVFQNYALFPHLDVAGNVAYGPRARGADRASAAERVATALDAVRLADYPKRKINELSGGQQQRVALARALATRPDLLLLDEPLSNLDAALRLETREELRRLQAASGLTAIYVTHDQEEALAVSDRLAVMAAGRVQQVGTPREVYETPVSAGVASFLGRANLAPVVVEQADGTGWQARWGAHAITGVGPSPVAAGEQALLLLRPERLTLATGGLPATVTARTYLGARCELTLTVEGRPWLLSTSAAVDTAAGEPVRVDWEPSAARLLPFDERFAD